MKILFSNPPWFSVEDNTLRTGIRAGSRWPFTRNAIHAPDTFEFGGYLPFPHFLAHAASYTKMLMPEAFVVVRDSITRGESYPRFWDAVAELNPDWIVVETATAALAHDLSMVGRSERCHAKWILCGPIDEAHHDTILKENHHIHAIIQGEYDKQIAKAIRGERGVYRHDLLTREEMASPPFPIWDEECATHYWDACPEGQRQPQLQMWTSRGCPYKCCFCVFPATMTGNDPDGTKARSVRFHSPQWVENYIWDRIAKHNFQCVYFDDDTFNLNNQHTLDICQVMKKIGLPWSAMCRADTIPQDTWKAMKNSGCFGVKLGFESGSQYVIDHIVNKRLDLKKAAETAIWLQREVGIRVHGTFTVGLPGETAAQAQETHDFIKHLYDCEGLSTHQLSGTATIEGTPLSRIAKGEHLEKYDGATSEGFVVSPDGQRKIEQLTH